MISLKSLEWGSPFKESSFGAPQVLSTLVAELADQKHVVGLGALGRLKIYETFFCVPTVHYIAPTSHTIEANYTLIYKGLKAE